MTVFYVSCKMIVLLFLTLYVTVTDATIENECAAVRLR